MPKVRRRRPRRRPPTFATTLTFRPRFPPLQPIINHPQTTLAPLSTPSRPPGLATTRSFPSFGSLASLDAACLALLDPAPCGASPRGPDLAPLFCEWAADVVEGGVVEAKPVPPSGAVAPTPAGNSDADSPPPSPKREMLAINMSQPATPRGCAAAVRRRHGTPASCDGGGDGAPPAKRARPARRRARPARYDA